MSDYRAFAKCKVDRPATEGVSVSFLGTNNQIYGDLLRQKPLAKSDFCRVRLDAFGRYNGGPKTPKKRLHAFSRYHMKSSGNETLH